MGGNGSALTGKAVIVDEARPFTLWGEEQVQAAYGRFKVLGGKLALRLPQFAKVGSHWRGRGGGRRSVAAPQRLIAGGSIWLAEPPVV